MPNKQFWTKTNAAVVKARPHGKREERQRTPAGLEIEAAFEKWITFVREHLGRSYSWHGPSSNDLERINFASCENDLRQLPPQQEPARPAEMS